VKGKIMIFGLDFGTTNSSIAVVINGKVQIIPPDPLDKTAETLPSLLYVTREYEHIVGREAAERYMKENTGRPSNLVKRLVSNVEVIASAPGSGIFWYYLPAYAMHDTLEPGRLLESIKTALRSKEYEGTQIFDKFYTIEELIGILLGHLRVRAQAITGQTVDTVVLGRPVRYSRDPEVNSRAETIMRDAAELAGFRSIGFQFEPIAAGYDYIQTCSIPSKVCIFDFGGGTLDMAVMHVEDRAHPEILATGGLELGGDDFNKRLFTLLYKYFGKDTTIEGKPFPSNLLAYLANWREMPNLCLPDNLRIIKRAQVKGSKPETAKALESLAVNHYGFTLYKEVERAKISLSDEETTAIRFSGKDIEIDELVPRVAFARLIEEDLEKVADLVDSTLEQAGVKPQEIDYVVRTGGSSQIVSVINLLKQKFGADKVQTHSLFTGVVSGLAVYAKEASNLT
jgi:hypothetical chaperone protein